MKKVEITEIQQERMKVIQLDMLKEVDRICNKYNIIYCLGFGTMLGAVRHKGFIPWDDDADILMLREDYDKFKSICAKEMPEKYFLQDADTDEEYLWGYAKLRNTNTEYIRCGQEHIKCKTGVFIDIFPLDEVPDGIFAQIYQDWICTLLRKELWAKVGQFTEKNVLKKAVFHWLAKVPKEKIYERINKMVYGKHNSKSARVRCLLFVAPGKHWNKKGNPLKTRYGFEKQWITERKKFEFEGSMFWGTKDYDSCLKYLYGDYMKLPPEEKRVGHAPVSKIDLKNEGEKDNLYWNKFYMSGNGENKPTLFAEYVSEYLQEGKKIVDIGCGNGRDSVYFMEKGMDVYAVDISEAATGNLAEKYGEKIHVVNENFVKMLGQYHNEFDYLYSRFTIHAISEEEQRNLLVNAYEALKPKGFLFIEVRCKLDEIYGKGELVDKDTYFYNGHRRRFLDKDEIEEMLRQDGFSIEYSKQDKDFAPYKEMNPIILRIVSRKI